MAYSLIYIIIIFFIILIIFYIINKNKLDLSYEYYPSNETYTAIIIEPREHKALEFVLINFLENLNYQWNFIIFHGNKNKDYLLNILKTSPIIYKNLYRIKLINLNIDNLRIPEYSKLLVSEEFHNYIPTEIFLIFQTDSIICKENKDLIYKFLKYDYSGAPLKCKLVGNGGLSLRKKSKMLEIIKNCQYKNEPEDVYFSVGCDKIKISKPSFEESKYFSVEAYYNDNSFGVHKPWTQLTEEQLYNKNRFCKGLNKLTKLNKKN